MKLLTATVTKKARLVETKYGPKVVADVALADGENVTLWQPETSQLINYGTGQKISLTLDSKGKYHFIESTNENAITPKLEINKTQSNELTNAQKREIAEYISQQSKLFDFCYQQTKLIDGLESEDRRAVATSLFIQAVKKFNL